MTEMTDENVLVALREARAALTLERPEVFSGGGAGEGNDPEVRAAAGVGLAELLDQLAEITGQWGDRWDRGGARAEVHRDLEQHLRSAAACARQLHDPPTS